MQSLIIIGKDKEGVREKSEEIIRENGVSKFDISTLTSEKIIGIADIRDISKKIFLKPIQGEKKAIVVEAFSQMTVSSQNAFLKILEEPPLSTIILILANENFFLPTILSRCTLIELDKGLTLTKDENDEFEKIIADLQSNNFDKLKLAQNLSKDRSEALIFLEKLLIASRNKMVEAAEDRGEYKNIIEILNRYRKEIKNSNVNLRLALENLFLEI